MVHPFIWQVLELIDTPFHLAGLWIN